MNLIINSFTYLFFFSIIDDIASETDQKCRLVSKSTSTIIVADLT